MNQTDFTYMLQRPQTVTKEQTEDLKSIVNEFPYFQSARAMYLKGLKNMESFKYNQVLKTTAAHTTDRSILFDFITSENFKQDEISQFIQQNTSHLEDLDVHFEDITTYKSNILDPLLEQHLEDAKGTLDPSLFQPKIEKGQVANFEFETTEETKEKEVPEKEIAKIKDSSPIEVLNLGKPLQFEKSETHSFSEWLSLTSLKPIDRDNEKNDVDDEIKADNQQNETLTRNEKFELIEQFISKSPKLPPVKRGTSNHNIAKEQMIQPEALMTETLARIYVEQKNYKKAIQSYKILSLKYPEKSGFFADQIKAVKQLQEQNNIK